MAFVFILWSKIKPAHCKVSDLDPILYFRTQNEIEPFSNRERLIPGVPARRGPALQRSNAAAAPSESLPGQREPKSARPSAGIENWRCSRARGSEKRRRGIEHPEVWSEFYGVKWPGPAEPSWVWPRESPFLRPRREAAARRGLRRGAGWRRRSTARRPPRSRLVPVIHAMPAPRQSRSVARCSCQGPATS